MQINFDVDIDMADRDTFLKLVPHVPASINHDAERAKHNTGVYFQNIPHDPLVGTSLLDYKEAEAGGYFKVDFLNNSIYEGVRDEHHLDELLNREPVWELLRHKEIVEQLFHISNYSELLNNYGPRSIDELAMVLAIIRPAKRHLQGKTFEEIRKDVWTPPEDGAYYFKHAHSISYAAVIVVQLNLIVEQLSQPSALTESRAS